MGKMDSTGVKAWLFLLAPEFPRYLSFCANKLGLSIWETLEVLRVKEFYEMLQAESVGGIGGQGGVFSAGKNPQEDQILLSFFS